MFPILSSCGTKALNRIIGGLGAARVQSSVLCTWRILPPELEALAWLWGAHASALPGGSGPSASLLASSESHMTVAPESNCGIGGTTLGS